MEQVFIQNAIAYAARHQLQLEERLGFGIHGIIYVAEDKTSGGKTAIKAHREHEPFHRELSVYARLLEAEVTQILGFHVPQFIRADADLWVMEMSIVRRPFALDFAGAYLESPPHFSDEIWAEWDTQKREQFGPNWPTVLNILSALEEMDIYMIDVSPSNIAFATI